MQLVSKSQMGLLPFSVLRTRFLESMCNPCAMHLTFHTSKQDRHISGSQEARNFPLIYTLGPRRFHIHFETWSYIWTGPKLLSFMRMIYPWLVCRSWSSHLRSLAMFSSFFESRPGDPSVKHWLTWKPGTFTLWLWTSNRKAFPHFLLQCVQNIHNSKVQQILIFIFDSEQVLQVQMNDYKYHYHFTSFVRIFLTSFHPLFISHCTLNTTQFFSSNFDAFSFSIRLINNFKLYGICLRHFEVGKLSYGYLLPFLFLFSRLQLFEQDIEVFDLENFKYNFVNMTAFRIVDSTNLMVKHTLRDIERYQPRGQSILNKTNVINVSSMHFESASVFLLSFLLPLAILRGHLFQALDHKPHFSSRFRRWSEPSSSCDTVILCFNSSFSVPFLSSGWTGSHVRQCLQPRERVTCIAKKCLTISAETSECILWFRTSLVGRILPL